MSARYAIYFAPPQDSALWRFGSATIGYDAATGADVALAPPEGIEPAQWAGLTEEPRRYGFHATLKAPFALAEGRSEAQLRGFARSFAVGNGPVTLAGLSPCALGRFVALTPDAPSEALQALAFAAVQAFESFRAPLSEADRARRLASPLTPAEVAYLEAYGYPYVGDAFRFHMTLTGRLPPERVEAIRAGLAARHAEAVGRGPVVIDRISLFRQEDRDRRFVLIDTLPLG